MKALSLAAVVVVLLVVFISQPVSAQDRAAFEKALLLEEAQAQLEEAISAYQEIIDGSADPALAAQAQLHVGICYEKLGLEQAQLAYQKVIDNYPTQIETVNLAKEKLSVLKIARTPIDIRSEDFQLQQVWAEAYDTMGSPSPDGRYMSYVNWNVPCLAIYEFETEKSRDITTTKGTWEGDSVWAGSSIWSPDGKKLAYVWYGQDHVSIRTVGIDSSDPVEIFGDKKLIYCHPNSWSADGKYILAVLCHKDSRHEIVLISLDDHSVKSLKILKPGYHPWTSLSPDGKFVSYSFTPDMNSPKTDIFLLSTDDGTEKTLIDHPATDFNPLWMPDGKNIIFFSDRTGTVSAWSQKVSDGTADGEEKLIMDLNRLSPKTIIPNGDLYISFLEGGHDVYNAIIDPETGKVISAPKRVVETNEGWNGAACFSPDGKIMAYVSQRGVLDPTFSWGQQSLILRDVQTGEERELIPRSSQLVRGRARLKWSPDSDEILFVGRDQTGQNGAFVLNIGDASFESITTGEKDFKGADVVWGNDSNKFYFFYQGDGEKNGVYSLDRNSHEETKILSESNIYGLAHRPGNNELAVIAGNVIILLNLENNEVAEFLKLEPDVKHSYIEWSPDGNWLYLIKCFGEGTVELWRVDANGDNAQLIEKSFPHLINFSIHPDGKRLAFTAGKVGGDSSIWVMKNFLK